VSLDTLTRGRVATDLSLEEWFALPEDEPGELIDGRLVEEEVPSYVHEFVVALLSRLLVDWILPRRGLVAGSDAKFAVGPGKGRKPDLTVYFPGSRFPAPRGVVSTPPDVAVEVVSGSPEDGRRDRVEKMGDYAAFGVRFYWILDPQLRSLEIFELGPSGRYTHALGASGGTLDPVPGCPDLAIDLDALWAEVDRLERQAEPGPSAGET
jgi:Uma2 family endonuclease